MSFILSDLPYPKDALAPHISAETIEFHYHKHHSGYIDRLNGLTQGTELESSTLEEVITTVGPGGIFNNAAQIWNHTFYWESMSPSGGGEPSGAIAQLVESSFGSGDKFREEFFKKSMGVFGSGWVWLVQTADSTLEIQTTQNANLPLSSGDPQLKALLTLDVWEHAYYLDYKNLRADYVKRWLEHLINWEFANSNL